MRDHPLVQLTLARMREFYREPEAIFWVFGFPLGERLGKEITINRSEVSSLRKKGGVLDKTRKDAAGNTIYAGVVPGDVAPMRDFYKAELPKHGYTLGKGDSESEEAEADFTGHGADGHFKLRDISGCNGALTLEVALR